jgi:hypothetical protein
MSGNGSRTFGTTNIAERLWTAALGQRVEMLAVAVSFVAALGNVFQTIFARLAAAGSAPASGTATWVSGSAGHLLLESLLLNLLGVQGRSL